MSRSAALNPASMPFFPGGLREDEVGSSLPFTLRQQATREQDRGSMSSLSVSSSDFRSVKSSPSPPSEVSDAASHQNEQLERSRPHQSEASRYPYNDDKFTREISSVVKLDTLLEGEDTQETPSPLSGAKEFQTEFTHSIHPHSRETLPTPPANQSNPITFHSTGFSAASPVSSLGSSIDHPALSFEAQIKASPLIHDILDRLSHWEMFTRDIQRDLSDLHRKVNMLVERSLQANTQPEFKDPFAAQNFVSPFANGPRPSIGNIAPNQQNPSDDISSISQRLNTLTSSVGQLLALQTQQLQSSNIDMRSNSAIGFNPQQTEIAPNQIVSPPALSNPAMLGHGIPHRQDLRPSPRPPNPPMRTWSAGTLDLPARGSDNPSAIRQDPASRDKRRSVTGLLRRESSGMLDPQGEFWPGSSSRENGPVISKWEQLTLAPELLRSLTKFGVGPPNKIQQRALPFLLRGSDIIAQAPPTQERIAAYVIPAIQIAITHLSSRFPVRGPVVVMVSTTVDQATQAQRMIRDLGGPIGIRSALGVGATSATTDLAQELRLLQQSVPHIICGTPQKLHSLFTSPGGISGSDVRFLVLDEVDQLIARNLHEFVFNIVKLLPPSRSRPIGSATPNSNASPSGIIQPALGPTADSSGTANLFQSQGRRFSAISTASSVADTPNNSQTVERQTALFSNTVPQDVLNLATTIQLREPVRVLVRRDGNVTGTDANQGSRGLRQFYLYLAFTAGGRSDPSATAPGGGLGIIGSGRSTSNAETAQAREWKLDALADLFDDVEINHAIVHVGGMTSLDSVVYKLASRGIEAIPLHNDMNAATKIAAINKFRNSNSVIMRQSAMKVLVVYDVQVKSTEVSHTPLIINYDLPKAVEEYAHRVAPAGASAYARAGVVVNFVTATGGDVEMLRSIECFYKIKCPEVPMSLRDIV